MHSNFNQTLWLVKIKKTIASQTDRSDASKSDATFYTSLRIHSNAPLHSCNKMKSLSGFRINKAAIISAVLLVLLYLQLSSRSDVRVENGNGLQSLKGDLTIQDLDNTVNSEKKLAETTPFMPHMGNETLKAELGRATWKVLHTVLARYPENPTPTEQSTLRTFIHSLSKVYPCGECARHFALILAKYPPQVGTRKNAALWGCVVHNAVNKRLGKPQYDCTTVIEDYDCGCGEEGEESENNEETNSAKRPTADDIEHLKSIKVESSEFNVGG